MKILNLISITDAGITKIFKRAGYVYELRAPYVKYLILYTAGLPYESAGSYSRGGKDRHMKNLTLD